MKKYILYILIILAMSFGSVQAKTFSDTKDTRYDGVVDRISELGIVNGTSGDKFEPNKSITRAEMAKILVTAYGLQDIADDVTTKYRDFLDVTTKHWAYKYIVVASTKGLINGYPNGKFMPEKTVTYSEAVAMILRSLGHRYISEDSEYGWDYNYILKMREIGLNRGVKAFYNTDEAKRGEVAYLIWNMVNSDMYTLNKKSESGVETYGPSGKTLMNTKFDEYVVIDDVIIDKIGVKYERYAVYLSNGKVLLDTLKVPFSSIGASITAMYKKPIEEKETTDTKTTTTTTTSGTTTDSSTTKKTTEQQHEEALQDKIANDKSMITASIIGVTYDDGTERELKEGLIDELKEDGFDYKTSLNVINYNLSPNYAYLTIYDGSIRRALVINSRGSYYVDEIEKKSITETTENLDGTTTSETRVVYLINASIEIPAKAIIMKKDEYTSGDSISEGDVVTEITKDELYFVTKDVEKGNIKKYDSKNKIITINKFDIPLLNSGTYFIKKNEQVYSLSGFTNAKYEKYQDRKAEVYMNFAGQVTRINFDEENATEETEEKEEDKAYKGIKDDNYGLYYVVGGTGLYTTLSDLQLAMANKSTKFSFGKDLKKPTGLDIGSFVYIEKTGTKTLSRVETVTDGSSYYDYKLKLNYDKKEYKDDKIGEYEVDEDTRIYEITKYYQDNSDTVIEKCEVRTIENISEIENWNKYNINILYDKETAKCIYLENEKNKFEYIYGRISSVEATIIKNSDGTKTPADLIKVSAINKAVAYCLFSPGIYSAGDIIAYKNDGDNVVISQVYKHELIGFGKDYIVTQIGEDYINVKRADEAESSVNLENNIIKLDYEYNLDDYRVIYAKVAKLEGEWKFFGIEFVDFGKIDYEVGDRISFGEIDNVIVVYTDYNID